MPGLSGFRDNETGHARANVVTPPPTLVNLVTIGSLAIHRCCSSAWRSHVTYLTFGSNCGPQLWRSCDICLAECGVYSSKHPASCRSPAVTYFTLVADVTGYRSFAAYMERLALM